MSVRARKGHRKFPVCQLIHCRDKENRLSTATNPLPVKDQRWFCVISFKVLGNAYCIVDEADVCSGSYAVHPLNFFHMNEDTDIIQIWVLISCVKSARRNRLTLSTSAEPAAEAAKPSASKATAAPATAAAPSSTAAAVPSAAAIPTM